MTESELLIKAELDVSHVDSQYFEHISSALSFRPNSSTRNIIEKLIAYSMLHHNQVDITKQKQFSDEPELFIKGNDFNFVHWVTVGNVPLDILEKAEARSEHVWIFFCEQDKNQKLLKNINKHPKLQMVELENDLIQALEPTLDRNNSWTVLIDNNELSIASGNLFVQSEFVIHHPLTIPVVDLIH